ncbi:MAG: hypothetical protein C0483_24205 [Pirellula sp.]|nr:hypothetical protein [Pirellula sp.]
MTEGYLVEIDLGWVSTHLTQEHPDAKVCDLEDAKAYLREHGFVEEDNGWVCDERALATLRDNEMISSKPI